MLSETENLNNEPSALSILNKLEYLRRSVVNALEQNEIKAVENNQPLEIYYLFDEDRNTIVASALYATSEFAEAMLQVEAIYRGINNYRVSVSEAIDESQSDMDAETETDSAVMPELSLSELAASVRQLGIMIEHP